MVLFQNDDGKIVSRRDFLKLGGLAIGGLSLGGLAFDRANRFGYQPPFPYASEQDQGTLARVASAQIDLHVKPNDEAEIIGNRFRDQLVQIYDEVVRPMRRNISISYGIECGGGTCTAPIYSESRSL